MWSESSAAAPTVKDVTARCYGCLMGARQRRGEPRDLRDSMIAGIALAGRAVLATHNVKHFDDGGIEIVNPSQA